MKLLKFDQFINEAKVNEAQIKDKTIIAKLDRIHEIKDRLKELTAETKAINTELGAFDATMKPIFDAMKVLNDKLATTERYVIKISRYGGTSENPSYAKAVEQALGLVDEAARSIINECVRQNTAISNVKHSYDIEKLDESKLTDKAKAMVAKLSVKISAIITKLKSFFESKFSKIDQANEKLAAMLK
jgi:septal ring factor EnvC (AmiA/AmiB activator)